MIRTGFVLLVILSVSSGRADPPDAPPRAPTGPDTLMMDFELNDRQVVERAARSRTTIQEAPAIITVITEREIRDRGYRTVSDLLRSVPGFEGDRVGFNGWFRDPFPRGMPGTTLVLLDGVNIVDPIRNMVVLDRKIPMNIIKRVEVTSGPGGVLWGSNALLGVVNIITHTGDSAPGSKMSVGFGDGPGARGAASGHAAWGGSYLDGDLSARISATWYTTRGPSLLASQQKLLGPFPAPAPDGLTLLQGDPVVAEPFSRDHYVNVSGNVRFNTVTLGFLTGWEREFREIASSGGVVTAEPFASSQESDPTGLVTRGSDPIHMVYARYKDRFLKQNLGITAQAQYVRWQATEAPFGIFPRSILLPRGGTTFLESEGTQRAGLNVDMDWHLPAENHLLFGFEVFGDLASEVESTYFNPLFGPEAGASDCPSPFEFHPELDAARPCSVRELALSGASRVTGAIYAVDEWKANDRLAINLGVRGQFSSTYNPALLLGGGIVVGLADKVFFKTTYSEGFRPPDFQSTAETRGIAAGVTFEANPNLQVETSRSVEVEVNAVLLENVAPIKQLYLRADYSYTRMENVITFPAGRFENSGVRDIHSVEALAKLVFYGDHELWLGYYFVDVVDSEEGRLRNLANHILNAGGRLSFLDGRLQLSSVLTVRGSMEDLNRTADQATSGGGPIQFEDATWVSATGLEVTEIPTTALLRFGIEGRRIFDFLDIGAWVYNALDVRYSDPDLFFDDRVMSQPQPREGLSFFTEMTVRW